MSNNQPDYEQEIRRRIERRYNHRIEFFSHLTAFVVIVGIVWFVWLTTTQPPRNDVISWIITLGSAGWLAGLLIHAINYILTEQREQAIERTIEQERLWWGEKPKRDQAMRLSDEGELLEIVDDEPEYNGKRKPR